MKKPEKKKGLVKKAWEKSGKVKLLGIENRLIVFCLLTIIPVVVTLLIFSMAIVILAGGMAIIYDQDPSLQVSAPKTEDTTSSSGSGSETTGDDGRSVEIPESVKGKMLFPAGHTMTSAKKARWGRQHLGIDLAGQYSKGGGGEPIYPIFPGVVQKSFYSSSFGNTVVIQHNLGGKTLYSLSAHMIRRDVKTGQKIEYNTRLGIMGNTGSASKGVHLHLELHDSNYTYGNNDVREKSALKPTDFLYCTDTLQLPNKDPQDISKCMAYRFKVVK